MNQADVLVVGAGPVGLTLAAEMARRGIRPRIVDQSVGPSSTSKAIAIQPRTLEIFRHMGIIDEVLARGYVVGAGNFYCNGRLLARIDFRELDTPYRFIVDLPQNETEQVLLEHLARNGIAVERDSRLLKFEQDATGVTVEVARPTGGETVRCSYLVGCDGAYSTVRHALGVQFAIAPKPELLALADVEIDWLYPHELHIFMHSDGFMACFPLPGGRFRLIADLTAEDHSDQSDRPPKATPERFRELLRHRAEPDANISEITWLAAFRMQRQVVESYGTGRVFIAGDAAHVPSPAGGQGMNTGIQDVCNLAWKLHLALSGSAAPALLDSYTAERAPVGRNAVAISDALAGGVAADLQSMVHQISELGINYRDSPIVAQNWSGDGGPEAGDRAPLIHHLDGTAHNLLLFTAGSADFRPFEAVRQLAPQGLVLTRLVSPIPTAWDEAMILDEDLSIHTRFGATCPCVYVVRPDGYIGYRGAPVEPSHVSAYLSTIFRR